MMLQVNELWTSVALRVTEEDGVTKGDRSLLRVLLRNAVVLKPNDRNQEKYETNSINLNSSQDLLIEDDKSE